MTTNNMAATRTANSGDVEQFPIYVRLCQEDIVKNDLLMKSIIQVRSIYF